MPIQARGKGFQATVNHKGERYRRMFPTAAQAEEWEAEARAALAKGELPLTESDEHTGRIDQPKTMAQLYDAVFKRYWQGTASEKSQGLNGRKCVEGLGELLPFVKVDEEMIDSLIFRFETEGCANGTVNRRLSALSKMMTHAYERGWVARKPKIQRKKETENRIRYFTTEEEREILSYFRHIGQEGLADLFVIGVDTGMRMGEILRIEARDMHDGVLSIWKTKSGRPRSIPMTDRVREILERRAGKGTERVFKEFSYFQVRHYWEHVRRHMGMIHDSQFVLHAMRHTFCSRLVQRGVDIVTVKELAGHSTVTVTMRYAHLAPHNLTNAIKALQGDAMQETQKT